MNSVETKGAELVGDYRPLPGWRVHGSLSYIDSQYKDDYFSFDSSGNLTVPVLVDGNQLPDQAEIIASASVSWEGENYSAALDGQFMDDRFADTRNTLLVQDYTVFNASVAYKGSPGTRFERHALPAGGLQPARQALHLVHQPEHQQRHPQAGLSARGLLRRLLRL